MMIWCEIMSANNNKHPLRHSKDKWFVPVLITLSFKWIVVRLKV